MRAAAAPRLPARSSSHAACPPSSDVEEARPCPAPISTAVGWGEDLAADWYRRHGYDVVARNWRCPIGEVDLIVRRGRLVVVVRGEGPAHRRLRPGGGGCRAAEAAAAAPPRRRVAGDDPRSGGVEVRFDVVAVTGDHLEVIERAF